jgi:stalled ribosome alternative rescue factor ArfA
MSKHNAIAQDLRTPKYKLQVVKNKKGYTRKIKHKGDSS